MRLVRLAHELDFQGWRNAARALALEGVAPGDVAWEVGTGGDEPLVGSPAAPAASAGNSPAFAVPRAFLTLAETVIRHPAAERFGLLYALLLGIRRNPAALSDGGGSLLARLEAMAREVRGSLIGEPAFSNRAGSREKDVAKGAAAPIGDNTRRAWEAARDEAARCTRCHLYKRATQTVFGEGPIDAEIMLVGEQPGDQEDLAGRPFVGPAGQVLDRALAEAGIDRRRTYVTNAVKHFKFEPRGKRRIHQKPDGAEIEACRWWLEQERALIRPAATIALGATAARSLFGKTVTISRTRGVPHQAHDGGEFWVTVHPSFLLRIPEAERKEQEYRRFVEDLARIGERLKAGAG